MASPTERASWAISRIPGTQPAVETVNRLAPRQRPRESFNRLMAFQVTRAREHYRSGRELLDYLPRRARACVGAMAGIYSAILDDIERDPGVVFRRRVSPSTGQKLALAGRELVRSLAP